MEGLTNDLQAPTSTDTTRQPSTAFALLHPHVQRKVYGFGWDALREVQERAILCWSDLTGTC